MKKLAFVIPYYKIDFFEDTLIGLSTQTNKNFNVYIGNDNSKNDPEDIINKYRSSLNIHYRHFDNNLGATDLEGHWKRCIDLTADEEWLCILADDDYPKQNFVEQFYKVVEVLDHNNINVVKAAITSINSNSEVRGQDLLHPEMSTSIDHFWRDRNEETYTSISENIFRKKSYLEKGFRGFPLAWGTPLLAWIDFSEAGYIYGLNSTQMCVRVSEINLSRTDAFKDQKTIGEAMVYEIIFKDYAHHFNDKQLLFLLKKYHAVLHYYKLKNKLSKNIITKYTEFDGLKGILFYLLRELKWKVTN